MKTALTIAGSDSLAGAGIQEDLKVFATLGVYGTSVITAVTAQNTKGIHAIKYLPEKIISGQIDSILNDIKIDAVKTGMLGNPEIAGLVYKKLKEYSVENLIVDPVLISTTGTELLSPDALKNLKKLINISTLATPNVYEAEILSGIKNKINNIVDMKSAAEKIGDCIITGGDFGNNEIYDLLFFNGEFYTFKNKKNNDTIHGTGCSFSAAITAGLSKGENIFSAVKNAEEFTSDLIAHNFSINGAKNLKLLNPFVDLERFRIIENIQHAIENLISYENSYKLMPQVGINIAMALPFANDLCDVAGVSGRIVKDQQRLVPVGDIKFGGSSHIGRVVLTAMKFNPQIRAVMNIKFSDDILKICEELNLKISGFERDKQPADTKTMEWGTKTAIEDLGFVPDVIYDKGGFGKEAMIRIPGNSATDVALVAGKIGKFLQ